MTDPTQTPEYRENLAQIAEALMETTARNCPGWHPADCPSEIVVDLVNERDDAKAELAEICKELGCTTAPGVALRFAQELRRDLGRAHQRHVELIQTWDTASPTERQELDRLRRGWGPSTPTERMARRTDLQAAMRSVEEAMTAVLPPEERDEEPTWEQLQAAYDVLSKAHREVIDLLQALPELSAPNLAA